MAAVGLLLVAATCSSQLYFYWKTDAVYQELTFAQPRTRAEVEAILTGFRSVQILEPELMQSIAREKLEPDREYWRYTKYRGFPIDVVYERDGTVFSLWPEYE